MYITISLYITLTIRYCMSITLLDKTTNSIQSQYFINAVKKTIQNKIHILFYVAAISTIAGGILHLLMVGPSLKPANFPMEILPYTDALFILSGLMQIFWSIPMIMRWGTKWYQVGLIGTLLLTALLLITRIPNGITGLPLEDKNPMALLTEISQIVYITATILIIKYTNQKYPMTYRNRKHYFENNTSNQYPSGKLTSMTNSHTENTNQYQKILNNDTNLLKEIEQEMQNNHTDSKLWIMRGIVLRKLGNNDDAITSFEEAIDLNPIDSSGWYQKGVSLNVLGRKDEAMEMYGIAKSVRKQF